MKTTLFALAALTLGATQVAAEAEKYVLDPGHSQILFSVNHLGYSTTYGMFGGFDGVIEFDQAEPAKSSVVVSFPATSMLTGWEARYQHFMTADFFDPAKDQNVTFTSTAIEVTGENTANITGDLTINAVTKPVVLEAVMNQAGDHPMEAKPWAGFSATTTILRSDFGLGNYAPYISDEVAINISIEASKAE